ncbi:MAG: tRNA (guanosine(37)-N1)-methyltransferase TrmD [Thiobacillaceae bacterium]
MRFDVISLFPEMFDAILDHGITRRALDRGLFRFRAWNPRDFTDDPHRTVDDRPYGGGPGMLMQAEPLDRAINAIRAELEKEELTPWVVHFSPRGRPLNHQRVMELKDATLNQNQALVLLCGRYEGIDERLLRRRVDEEISLGDFVLSGGELPALALMDAIIRQLPGALNDADSAVEESFAAGLLDCPHYTRPEVWQGEAVPDVLKGGNHAAIAQWRLQQSLKLTRKHRPDMLKQRGMSPQEQDLLDAG